MKQLVKESARRAGWLGLILAAALSSAFGAAEAQLDQTAPTLEVAEVLQGGEPAQVSLENLRGNAVVIDFWATWCGPCKPALQKMQDLAKSFDGSPIRFLTLTDETSATVTAYLKKNPLQLPVLLDREGSTFRKYGIERRPTTVLIDRHGILAGIVSPESVRKETLEALIDGKKLTVGDNRHPSQFSPSAASDSQTSDAVFQMLIRVSELDRALAGKGSGNGSASLRGYTLPQLLGVAYGTSADQITLEGVQNPDQRYDVTIVGRPRKTILVSNGKVPFAGMLREVLLDTFDLEAEVTEGAAGARPRVTVKAHGGKGSRSQ